MGAESAPCAIPHFAPSPEPYCGGGEAGPRGPLDGHHPRIRKRGPVASPFIGHAPGLTALQYGAWIGTGIPNPGQVLAAALAFNPRVEAGCAVSMAEIWNITPVMAIP